MDRDRPATSLIDFIVESVSAAKTHEMPFQHLTFAQVFPDRIYAQMLDCMPGSADYRRMSGRSTINDLPDGTPTRVKIDLFPEYVRTLPAGKQAIWTEVGEALRSDEVKRAFRGRLASGLERRFGARFADVGLYPIPVLTRDFPGYRIPPHPDTHWKAITVQLYLPRDASTAHVGTIFHGRAPDGSLTRPLQMQFAPNTGYAFAVGEHTWHSADRIGPEVETRDSILLTYYVDRGPLRVVRNRGKRLGNLVLNRLRRTFD